MVPLAYANKALKILKEPLKPNGFDLKKHHIVMNSEKAYVKTNSFGAEDNVEYEEVKKPYNMGNTLDDMASMLAAQGIFLYCEFDRKLIYIFKYRFNREFDRNLY